MAQLSDITILQVDGHGLTAADFLHHLKVHNQLDTMKDLIADHLIAAEAERRGINVSDRELQEEADRLRAEEGLITVALTEQWLKRSRMTLEELEERLECAVRRRKVAAAVTASRVDAYFAAYRSRFDAVELAEIVVADEGIAYELESQLEEEEATFAELAAQYSSGAEAVDGGALGKVSRSALEPEIGAAVFAARGGEVVGPLQTERGWHLLRIDAIHVAELKADVRDRIANALFEQWLQDAFHKATIEMPLFAEI
jgi:parvulin-like peptidyl-prolyl isomerase